MAKSFLSEESQRELVKIRFCPIRKILVAVMPSGEEIPCVAGIKIESNEGALPIATIELYFDMSEIVEHKE